MLAQGLTSLPALEHSWVKEIKKDAFAGAKEGKKKGQAELLIPAEI